MRIKPYELDIPKEEPFENDLLNRKGQAEILTSLIATIDGSCVLAIDAEWGMGKTTFLRMWSQHICNTGFPTIKFNAWETDFSDDPLLAMSTELVIGLKRYIKDGKLQHLIRLSQNVLRHTVPTGMRVITNAVSSGVLNIEPPNLRRELTSYERAKNSIMQLKDHLQEVANDVSETTGHPLIIIVDELDRCRPSYAIELLEVTKHLFSIDNIVFVLAINRSEIEHSIKVLYGDRFDSKRYLQRFINIDFRLPDPNRNDFIDNLITKIALNDYISSEEHRELSVVLLKDFFSTSDVSFRMIEQAIYRLGLLLKLAYSEEESSIIGAIIASILRTIEPNLYYQYIHKKIEDITLISELFVGTRIRFLEPPNTNEFHMTSAYLIATIILATISQEADGMDRPTNIRRESHLLNICKQLDKGLEEDRHDLHISKEIAKNIISIVNQQSSDNVVPHNIDFGFWDSVKYLELISPETPSRES